MKITVKTTTCDIALEVEPSSTVENVKESIQLKTGIHPRFQKLCFSNKELENGRKLCYYRLKDSSSIDFQLIVPSFDEVLDAMSSLKCFMDSHDTCTNEVTGSGSEQVSTAMIILKAFVDSHSCCAIAITEMLKKSELAAERHSKIKTLCETLLRENRVLTSARDEQIRKTTELEVKVHNLETELAKTKTELANTKTELANTKVELENQKSINQSLLEKVEFVSSAQTAMEQRIDELTARFPNT